ncbi:MAG TPA: deoxyribodipyrimidine photo-lyase, partial [Roseococcus sp.]|nr:deoxyribodipyrimidine photo-lyase [Roseococcus sp.]
MNLMLSPALLWFRQDLRLADNPALHAVQHRPLLAVYVLDDAAAGRWAHGGAQRWWLHRSLAALDAALRVRGIALHLARGSALDIVPALAAQIGADEVHAGRLYEPWARTRDDALAERLRGEGRRLALHTSTLLHEPASVQSGQGRAFSQYSPFARAIFGRGEPPAPLDAPARLAGPELPGLELDALELLPRPPIPEWWRGFEPLWTPGEAGGAARLSRFAEIALHGYGEGRNLPGQERTSGLSPHLRWGEVSPRQVWHAARGAGAVGDNVFLKEILWREFSYHLLWHRPEMPERALNPAYARFPAEPDAKLLHAFQGARTGYPIVDAGLRQLWQTGWMHNRVRMIVGSVLVKHLLQPWQDGAAWFWDTLVDADLAS